MSILGRVSRVDEHASPHEVVGKAAASQCYSLVSVDLSEGLLAIEEALFKECSSLKHLRIPSSVVTIEAEAFAHCTRLVSLELPEGLEMTDRRGLTGADSPACTQPFWRPGL